MDYSPHSGSYSAHRSPLVGPLLIPSSFPVNSWDHTATGLLIGLSTYTTRQHVARATLEATCYQTRALIDAMIKDTAGDHAGLHVLKVDGGMTKSDVTMQLQADILGIAVERPEMKE